MTAAQQRKHDIRIAHEWSIFALIVGTCLLGIMCLLTIIIEEVTT